MPLRSSEFGWILLDSNALDCLVKQDFCVFSISPTQSAKVKTPQKQKALEFSSLVHFRRNSSSAEATQMPLQSLALQLPLPPYFSSMCAGFAEGPCQELSKAI